MSVTVDPRDVGAEVVRLSGLLTGCVSVRGQERYAAASLTFNGALDRSPILAVSCATVDDVRRAFESAARLGLPVSVRGGGHSVAGHGVGTGSLLVDLSPLRGVEVDPVARRARVAGGSSWNDVDPATQSQGLAVPGGTFGDTGVGGLTLGGGIGWLIGTGGLTCDNLVRAELVTPAGDVVVAGQYDDADLLWALRGGGGNFGIVTSFEYRLHPVGPMIVGGMVLHPFERATEVLRFYRDFRATAPDQLTVAAVLVTAPDGHKAVALAAAYIGPVAEGELAVAPLKTFGPPVVDMMGPHPYLGQQGMLSNAMPPNVLNYWKADFVDAVNDDVIEAAVAAYAQAPSPLSSILFFPIHGTASRVAPDATAYPHRKGVHMGLYALWKDPGASAANIAWVRAAWAALQPFVPGGVYVNELGDDEGDDRVRLAYGRNYERLARVKRQYDPDNVLCLNANILPA